MNLHLLCTVACLLPLISTVSIAAPVPVISDPYYSAPGGYNSSTAGSPAQFGEQVKTYNSFDNSAYNSLYYAFGDAGPIGIWDTFLTAGPSLYVGTSEVKNPLAYDVSLSNLGAGLVTWSGTVAPTLFGNTTVLGTRFTMEITDIFDNVLSLTDAVSLGLDASLGGVLDVNGDFKVTLNALMQNTTGSTFTYNNGWGVVTCNIGDWCNAIPVYDRINGKSSSESLYTSYDNAFYSSPVPVPAAVWLFGSGLLGLIGMAKRKTHS